MASNCQNDKIFADILKNCNNIMVPGVKANLILFNYEDLSTADFTFDPTNPDVITAINLTTSPNVRGYLIEGYKTSVAPQLDGVIGTFTNTVNHQIAFSVFDNIPEVKEQIQAMLNGKFLAIVQNNYEGEEGNAAFELYGRVQGLELNAFTRAVNDAATNGAYVITLSSPAEQKEPKLPNTIFDTDFATTKAMIDSLVA